MPIQKGKRRKRGHRHPVRSNHAVGEPVQAVKQRPEPAIQGVWRRGRQASMRTNIILGVVMLLVGIYFFIAPAQGFNVGVKLLFLVGYLVVGSFYLFRAYRQYQERERSS